MFSHSIIYLSISFIGINLVVICAEFSINGYVQAPFVNSSFTGGEICCNPGISNVTQQGASVLVFLKHRLLVDR